VAEPNHPDRNGQPLEPSPINSPSTPLAPESNHTEQELPGNNVRLMRIPVECIEASSLQLRQDLDEQEVEGDLLASIDRFGLTEPPRVFLKGDGRAELIDGHRRLSAVRKLLKRYAGAGDDATQLKAARFQEITCLVEEIPPSDKKHLELQILLNAVRKNFSPVEQARYLRQIKELEPGMTQKELGALLPGGKKTQGYVSRLLILAQDDALLQRVENGELTAAEAYRRVAKRQEKSRPQKDKQATAPAVTESGVRKNSSPPRGKKTRGQDGRTTDAVLLEWQEKETRVNVIMTGIQKHQNNILFVLNCLVRQLELEAKHKPGND
jgi:ParB-like chromosome segregation protein Spo0J